MYHGCHLRGLIWLIHWCHAYSDNLEYIFSTPLAVWYSTSISIARRPSVINPSVLYGYECIITLTQEVQVIWSRKWSIMTMVYAFTRYTTVLLIISEFLPISNLAVRWYDFVAVSSPMCSNTLPKQYVHFHWDTTVTPKIEILGTACVPERPGKDRPP